MSSALTKSWRDAFFREVQNHEMAGKLKQSALDEDLTSWTTALTAAVVLACKQTGWQASAKAHKLELLPVQRSEYLSLDVVAFPDATKRWSFPVAIMELENQLADDAIGYSLWKVICVRSDLRVVFCYRRTGTEAASLLRYLRDEVVGAMELQGRLRLEGETVIVVGCRDEANTFPYGFFKWWALENNTGKFEQIW
jgi:hypothetical protein